jgi:hypothetical protein
MGINSFLMDGTHYATKRWWIRGNRPKIDNFKLRNVTEDEYRAVIPENYQADRYYETKRFQ